MSLKHIVSGLGVIVLGLLILSDEMLYDAYVMPPLENGAIITTPAAVNISGHMCFTHSYLNTCGNTMQCANAICNMSQQTINTSGFVMLMPIQCRLSSFGAMFEFPKYQATGIIMLITVGLLLLWILVFAGQSTLVRHNIPTRKNIRAVIRWIFLGLFVLTRLAVTGAVISYTLFHNDYSILWWNYLPSWLLASLLSTAVWYLGVVWWEFYLSYGKLMQLFVERPTDYAPLSPVILDG